jgi:hypothetical protein
LLSGLLLAGLSACKQGLGDRCQLDSDCESGLRCSTGSNMICENPALVVPDASTDLRDARTIPDAAFRPDAGPPSIPDAVVRPDAASADGPLDQDAPPGADAGPDSPVSDDAGV